MITNGQTTTHKQTATEALTLTNLQQDPGEMWLTMRRFSGPTPDEQDAMRQTVDVLMQRGYDLVVATYEHLLSIPETAAVLGWENGVDPDHLAERRRFFTLWLARTISMDFSADFGAYLYHAGQVHAAHGPRHIHTPGIWVTGSMGLVLGAFGDFITSVHDDPVLVAQALSGWNKVLMMHLNQMLAGYQAGLALDTGPLAILVRVYGIARRQWGRDRITVHVHSGEPVEAALRKLANYAPVLRGMLFRQAWQEEEPANHDSLWMEVEPLYILRDNWRILLNGNDLRYHGGFAHPLSEGDVISLFPPGR